MSDQDGYRSYHGEPVLKQPIWSWEIPCYFFTGGLGGASAGLAYLSELRGNEVLARRAWGSALVGLTVSPALLISDLGKPERFVNMLRMFKVSSPMSVGSWILAASAGTTALANADAWLGLFPRLGRLARPAAAILGLPLSTYTAALVSNTAVPVWHEAHRQLPFVFGAGAALSAGATAVAVTPPAEAGPARRLALASAALELGMNELMKRTLREHGQPYDAGPAARFRRASFVCIASGAALLAARGRSRAGAVAAGTLLCGGALGARWSVFKAGIASASDPKYVVGPQREAIALGRRGGASRSAPARPALHQRALS